MHSGQSEAVNSNSGSLLFFFFFLPLWCLLHAPASLHDIRSERQTGSQRTAGCKNRGEELLPKSACALCDAARASVEAQAALFSPCDTDPEGVKRVKTVVWVITRFCSPSSPTLLRHHAPLLLPLLLFHQQHSHSSLGE